MLYVFEDNEAVIKMIINGRSPTMRHVLRTHRVALDRLFDRINQDSKIQIRYTDTKHQLADMLTSHFSSTCCTKNFSLICCSTITKRIHDQKEEKGVSKSRPAAMNLSSFISISSSTVSSPTASESPEMPTATGKPDSWMSIRSTQRRLLKCD